MTFGPSSHLGVDVSVARRKLNNVQKMQQKQSDQKLIDSRRLRAERITALQSLAAQARELEVVNTCSQSRAIQVRG